MEWTATLEIRLNLRSITVRLRGGEYRSFTGISWGGWSRMILLGGKRNMATCTEASTCKWSHGNMVLMSADWNNGYMVVLMGTW